MTISRLLSLVVLAALASIRAVNAQFGGMPGMVPGMGMGPGMGGPGFGGRPAGPPACQQVLAMRDETQKNATALRAFTEQAARQRKPPDPAETCKLFKVYLASEGKFIEGLQTNAEACGVPAQIIELARARDGTWHVAPNCRR